MSDSSSSNNSGGIGVLGALGVVFVTLKLIGIIDWSWWYVLLPFYGVLALILVIIVGAFAVSESHMELTIFRRNTGVTDERSPTL